MHLTAEMEADRVISRLAGTIAAQSRPQSPSAHLIKGGRQTQLFIPNGSRLYAVAGDVEKQIATALERNDEAGLQNLLVKYGLSASEYVDNTPLESPRLYALSLAIAQKCNMGCTYCYADQGSFGGQAKSMSLETALKAIDLLMDECPEGEKVQLTFLGGEPLANRKALMEATAYAVSKAEKRKSA
jgi:uncharacterized protein